MVLLHKIIKIFRVAQDNGGLVSLVVVRDRCRVAATLVGSNGMDSSRLLTPPQEGAE